MRLNLFRKQGQVFKSRAQVKVVCAGRGFGKSILLLTTAILFCLRYRERINPISPPIALIAMPTLKMARSIHWLPLLTLLEKAPFVERVDKTDFRIQWVGDRPDLIIRGADRMGDRLRGLNVVWAGLDEFQDFHPDVWGKILKPALIRNACWSALVIGTPKGKASYFHQFHLLALKTAGWQYWHFVTADNPYIDKEEIAKAEAELPPKIFRQEFCASWEDFDGQLLPHVADHHKADKIPTTFRGVMVGGDWGDINPCLVVIGVDHSDVYYLIDYWFNDSGVPQTTVEIAAVAADFEKRYGVSRFFLPDDRPGAVKTFRQYGKKHNLDGMRRSTSVDRGRPGVMERAIVGTTLFYQDRLFFGPKCHDLYDVFISYHRAKDAAGNLLSYPEKRQNDHPIDATLYPIGQLEGRYVNG